jgi:HK97 family phage prohead protease
MTDLNATGESFARSLIASGAVDKTSDWSFTADDGNALLGRDGADWASYGKAHLGLDQSATDKTKARWKYPFAKGGKLYRSALTAIAQRAGQQNDSAIGNAASALLKQIDGETKSTGTSCEIEIPWEYKFLDSEADGTFEGYGAAFGNVDDNGDRLMPGAFDSTLAEAKSSGRMPKMLLNHGGLAWGKPTPEDLIPIGKWNAMSPDSKGLQVKGRLINLDTDSGKRIYGAMKEGELDGLSMGFAATKAAPAPRGDSARRILSGVNLLEVSPVTFQANRLAGVTSFKSYANPGIRFLESVLRDAGGLSRTEAKAILAGGFKAIALRDAAANEELAALNALASTIRSLS